MLFFEYKAWLNWACLKEELSENRTEERKVIMTAAFRRWIEIGPEIMKCRRGSRHTMANPYENFHTGQIKCDGRLLTSAQREQKAHFPLSTATYGHKQVAAGYWHLLLAMLGEQRLA